MRRGVAWILLLALLLPLPAPGQQLWDRKPVGQWDKKETEKFLRDSPWAKQCLVVHHPLFSRETIGTGRIQMGTPGSDEAGPNLVFSVRWISSALMRAALDRHAELAGAFKPSAVRLEHPSGDYHRIEVAGDPLNRLPIVDEMTLRESAYLKLGLSGRQVPAAHVRVRREPGYHRPVTLHFYFPRQNSDGSELIPENETEVEFVAPVGPRAFRAKFNPSRMKTREGLDY